MYYIFYSKKFSKSLNRLVRARRVEREEIEFVLESIASKKILDKKYKDHRLSGNMQEHRECHVRNDVLLQYKVVKDKLTIITIDIGSHSELFG